MTTSTSQIYIGLMSGTSLDGVDGVLVDIPEQVTPLQPIRLLTSSYAPFSEELRQQAYELQQAGDNEIHREALLGNEIARCYSTAVNALLAEAQVQASQVVAIGAHGQTIRHRPELAYTRQTLQAALLAELTGIDVIADLRSRDVAAGGQGAPLVPAFHRTVFGSAEECRVVANIGGISNISILYANGKTLGFDTGPGNVLMDAWIAQHQGSTYDRNGDWARSGGLIDDLLLQLKSESFFQQAAPKSTGRDLFSPDWLAHQLAAYTEHPAQDIQTTLTVFTAQTLADAIIRYAPQATSVYVCGGGAFNHFLLEVLQQSLVSLGSVARVGSTEELGVAPQHVEAMAFAWLAQRFTLRLAGNLPAVTGAIGDRVLGALYPK